MPAIILGSRRRARRRLLAGPSTAAETKAAGSNQADSDDAIEVTGGTSMSGHRRDGADRVVGVERRKRAGGRVQRDACTMGGRAVSTVAPRSARTRMTSGIPGAGRSAAGDRK